MKSRNILLLAIALSMGTAAFAQSEEQVLNSDPIDVDGYLREKQVTDGELEQIRSEIRKQKNEVQLNKDKSKGYKELSKTTEKLSDVTEEYIDEKKSAQNDIAEYNKKIKCLMEENPGKDCSKYVRPKKQEVAEVQQQDQVQEVKVTQAAPAAATSITDIAVPADLDKPFEEIKLLPMVGGTQYSGEVEQLEASISAGLRLEANVSTRFSMGFGFNYAQLKTEDFGGNTFNYGTGYYDTFGQNGREIQYKSMGIDVYGKFFITRGERFRPYIGAGLGYNRADMKYTNNDNDQNYGYMNGQSFGNETYKNSFGIGKVMLGTEVMVSRTFGFLIEGSAATNLGSSMSSQNSKNVNNNPDQRRLKALGDDIMGANVYSVFAGAVVVF